MSVFAARKRTRDDTNTVKVIEKKKGRENLLNARPVEQERRRGKRESLYTGRVSSDSALSAESTFSIYFIEMNATCFPVQLLYGGGAREWG